MLFSVTTIRLTAMEKPARQKAVRKRYFLKNTGLIKTTVMPHSALLIAVNLNPLTVAGLLNTSEPRARSET